MADATIPFVLCPDFVFTRVSGRRTKQTPASSGFVQRRRVVDREFRTFTLRFHSGRPGLIRAIEDLWSQTHGPVLGMLYTPPGEGQLEVRFAKPTLAWTLVSEATAQIEIELEENR